MYNLCMGLCVNLPGFSVTRPHNYIDKQITNCVRHRKNTLLILIGFKIVWDNVDSWHLPQIFLQGQMTSQMRESLGLRLSNTFPISLISSK